MKYEKKIYISIMWVVLGLTLSICGTFGLLKNDRWTGIGYGWLACGILQVIKQIRYRSDAQYRERVDIEVKDERNRYIAAKAWSWAGYGYVLVSAVALIAVSALGKTEIVPVISGGVCLIIVLYWISYMYLRKHE